MGYLDIMLGSYTKSPCDIFKVSHILEKMGRIVKMKQTPGTLSTRVVPTRLATVIGVSWQKKSKPKG